MHVSVYLLVHKFTKGGTVKIRLKSALAIVFAFLSHSVFAKTVRYELTIKNERVNLSGKAPVDFALAVNGQIPAPTLEFTEGDDAEILVKNGLAREEVSLHWHGILLPPEEDGVAYVNTPPIHPGKSRLFKFKIRQTGTFWYHSHTAVQEQKGVYGAFIIRPKQKPIKYNKEAILVISDWSDENADQIMANLRKDGDYYLYKKNSVRSIWGAIQSGQFKSYLSNEWTRMGGMDLSDVGYDAFLINGKRDSQLIVAHPGDVVRLRIINAAASSYFFVAMGVPMQVISADGVDVEPTMTNEILMGMAETYDVLFTVPAHRNYEIRATAQDVTGYASAWIGMGEKVYAPTIKPPDLYIGMDHGGGHGASHGGGADHSNHEMNHEMDHGMNHEMDHEMDHESHEHAISSSERPIDWSNQSDAMLRQNQASRMLSDAKMPLEILTVDHLKALVPTSFPKKAKIHDLKLVLGGDMERYVWHINGKAIYQDRLIQINRGEVVRFTFVNDTMMNHPMHLHGHFFRVINEFGEKSPLKHTVDVSPHSTRTIEFYANEPGQWMLHCHNLYHMKTGMARIVRYNDFKLSPEMAMNEHHDPHLHQHVYHHTQFTAASQLALARFRLLRTWDEIDLYFKTANSEGKNFSFREDWENEGDLFYRRWISNYYNIFGGASIYHDQSFGILGVGAILPMLIKSELSINHEGHVRIDLEKRLQWTSRVFSDLDFSWRPQWKGGRETEFDISLMYGPTWTWAAGLIATQNSLGVGAQVQF